jgi:hypothetical protein
MLCHGVAISDGDRSVLNEGHVFCVFRRVSCKSIKFGLFVCYSETGGMPSAAISATNIFVSAIITSLPSFAKTILADVVPRKNFPSNVPSSFHTYRRGHTSGSEPTSNKQSRHQTNLHAISTSRIHIAFEIDLEAIRDACIHIGEYSAVFEGVCAGIDIESISVCAE